MKLDGNARVRLYREGNAFWESGCIRQYMIGGVDEYSGWADESMSWKTDCYVGDWSSCLDDLYLSGPDAERFLQYLCTNTFQNFQVGKAKHYVMCAESGKVMAEGILMKLGEDEYLLQSNTNYALYKYYTNAEAYPNLTVRQPEYFYLEAYGFAIAADRFKFQVSGPKALALCEKLTGQDLKSVRFMNFVPVQIKGVDCIALRQGMAGEIGFEFQGPIQHRAELFSYIFQEGREFGCRRLGERTAMINHLEANFATYCVHYVAPIDKDYDEYQKAAGYEPYYAAIAGSFDGEWDELAHSPYEMGWDSCVKFDHDFIGRAALEKENESRKRKIVTLEFNDEDMIRLYASLFQKEQEPYELIDLPMRSYCHVQADTIYDKDGKYIGIATTPGYSIYFRKVLALSFVDHEIPVGTEVDVLWGTPDKPQTKVRAIVKPAPYKQDNRKVDLKTV